MKRKGKTIRREQNIAPGTFVSSVTMRRSLPHSGGHHTAGNY
jgi:hypothetical protein